MNQKLKPLQRNFGLLGCRLIKHTPQDLELRKIIFFLYLGAIMKHHREKMERVALILLMVATPCRKDRIEITWIRLKLKKGSKNIKTKFREELKILCIKNNSSPKGLEKLTETCQILRNSEEGRRMTTTESGKSFCTNTETKRRYLKRRTSKPTEPERTELRRVSRDLKRFERTLPLTRET